MQNSNNNLLFKYGRIIDHIDSSEIVNHVIEHINIPADGITYFADDDKLQCFSIIQNLELSIYGELPIQAGYVAGFNNILTGLEYHHGSEVIIAATDLYIFLGLKQDIINQCYDVKKIEGFQIKKGQIIELYSNTLHYCPCHLDASGFLAVILLLKGTNSPLTKKSTDPLLFRKNTWFLAHPTHTCAIANQAHVGLTGKCLNKNDFISPKN